MDGHRFDDMVRRCAAGISRRDVLAGVAGAALAALAVPGRAAAACLRNSRPCPDHASCCSHYCQPHRGRNRCAACASGIVCGDVCCPEGALNACTGMGGCLCPDGTLYDASENVCRSCAGEDGACATNDDCCSDTCCDGACCAEGTTCCGGVCGDGICCDSYFCDFGEECCGGGCCPLGQTCTADGRCVAQCGDSGDCPGDEVCCAGVCTIFEACFCPPGLACDGSATCSRCGSRTYTTEGTCCPFPLVGYCCTDSSPGAGDGFALCCHRDNCPPCPDGSSGAKGGTFFHCSTEGGGDCCPPSDFPGGDAHATAPCCLAPGEACDREVPCCGACDAAGVCACLALDEPCNVDFSGLGCCPGMFCFGDTQRCTLSS